MINALDARFYRYKRNTKNLIDAARFLLGMGCRVAFDKEYLQTKQINTLYAEKDNKRVWVGFREVPYRWELNGKDEGKDLDGYSPEEIYQSMLDGVSWDMDTLLETHRWLQEFTEEEIPCAQVKAENTTIIVTGWKDRDEVKLFNDLREKVGLKYHRIPEIDTPHNIPLHLLRDWVAKVGELEANKDVSALYMVLKKAWNLVSYDDYPDCADLARLRKIYPQILVV